jgi:predicted  nucleic acid-binding Zn-ribbon protein
VTGKHLQIRLLREFQDLEEEIANLEASTEEIPKVIQSIEEDAKRAKAHQANLEARRKDLEKERMHRESDIEAERDRMRKVQAKQLDVKTNKEYSALLHEIEGIKNKIDQFETETLELMETSEALEEEIRQGQGKLREQEAEAEDRKKEQRQTLDQLQKRLAGVREDQQRLSLEIEPDWLSEYRRIKAARGMAVAGLNGKSCGGCHQTLMPKLVHAVKHDHEIQTCPNCNRILFASEEEPKAAETSNPAEPA